MKEEAAVQHHAQKARAETRRRMPDLITFNSEEEAQLNFHKGQIKAWDAKQRFVFMLAGTQSGKTSFGPWWMHREIAKEGAGDYLAVTANYDLFKLKMLPEMQNVFENILQIGKYHKSERIIELCNPDTGQFAAVDSPNDMWARIILRSATAGAKKGKTGARGLESSTVKAAWIDECGLDEFSVEAWEAILRRTAIHQGRILGTTSLYNTTWLKSRVYKPFLSGDPDFFVVQFDSTENPKFPQAEFDRAKRTLQRWKFNMLYRGLFDKPAGMIYDMFEEKRHTIEPFPIPLEWPRYVGIDPGPLNTAVLWLAEDTTKKAFYCYRERLYSNETSKQVANNVLDLATNERIAKYTGGAKSELQFRLDWNDIGVPIEEPPISDVETGIDRIAELLNEYRLFIFNTCPILIEQFTEYSRKLDEDGEPTDEIRHKEKYHQLDALRYNILGATTKKVRVLIPLAS